MTSEPTPPPTSPDASEADAWPTHPRGDQPGATPPDRRQQQPQQPQPQQLRPVVVAHRGNSSVAPENTLAAFDAAADAGAFAIELDLQLSSDGVVVVIHDDDLDRTTNLVGAVGDTDARALASADAGSWFGPGFIGQHLPTLDDLITWAVAHPALHWLLEFKGSWSPRTVATVTDSLRTASLRTRSIVQSFDVATVAAQRDVAPDFVRNLLIEGLPDGDESAPFESRAGGLVTVLKQVGASGCNPDGLLLLEHPHLVALFHDEGFTVTPYTLDEPEHWAAATALGVDGIITNRPAELIAWQASSS